MSSDTSGKVTAARLRRDAYLYIRQSSLKQVIHNTESAIRQYDLRGKAVLCRTQSKNSLPAIRRTRPTVRAIMAHCATRLAPELRPRSIAISARPPRTVSGKVRRAALCVPGSAHATA